MKIFLRIALLLSIVLLYGSAEAAPPENLALTDLVGHPERWPKTVTVKKNLNFDNGKSVRKDQKATVVEFNGKMVQLSTEADWQFQLSPKECDFLSSANQDWVVLTPAQRAIELATLVRDPSLWPVRAKVPNAMEFENGGGIPAGTELDFISMDGGKVKLYSEQRGGLVTAPFTDTDLIDRARRLALIPANKRPSRVAYALKKIMVDSSGQPHTDPQLEDVQIFALYYGGAWCKYCREFSPTLVRFVNENGPKNPYFKTVMVSSDEESSAMLAYMKEKTMPWPAVPMKDGDKSALLLNFQARIIPTLIICDRSGKVLATSLREANGEQDTDTESTLQALTKILDSGAAR